MKSKQSWKKFWTAWETKLWLYSMIHSICITCRAHLTLLSTRRHRPRIGHTLSQPSYKWLPKMQWKVVAFERWSLMSLQIYSDLTDKMNFDIVDKWSLIRGLKYYRYDLTDTKITGNWSLMRGGCKGGLVFTCTFIYFVKSTFISYTY